MIKETLFFCSIAAADYSTSRYIINRGGYELNPLIGQSAKSQALFHTGKCVLQGFVASKIEDKKKKRIVMIVAGAIGAGFVIHNGREIRKLNKR